LQDVVQYIGCYPDAPESRLMGEMVISDVGMTTEVRWERFQFEHRYLSWLSTLLLV